MSPCIDPAHRILDHTTIRCAPPFVMDEYGDPVPLTIICDGKVYWADSWGSGYLDRTRTIDLYMEGMEDWSEFWYAEECPVIHTCITE